MSYRPMTVVMQLVCCASALMILSSCSSIYMTSTFERRPGDTVLKVVDRYTFEGDNHWINYSTDTYVFYERDSVILQVGTKFPAPMTFFGPPFIPIFPNVNWLHHRLAESDEPTFYMNLGIYAPDTIQLDLSKVHFYELADTSEISVDSMRFIPLQHWSLRESEIPSLIFDGLKDSLRNTAITSSVIHASGLRLVRFNLHLNTYELKDGLIIRFEPGFFPQAMPEVILIRKNQCHYSWI